MRGTISTAVTLLVSAIVGASIGASHVMMLRVRHQNEDQVARYAERERLLHGLYVAQQRFALLDSDGNGEWDFCGDLERLLYEATKHQSESAESHFSVPGSVELVITPDRRRFCFVLPPSEDGLRWTINHLAEERLLHSDQVIDPGTCAIVAEVEHGGNR